MNTLLAMLAIVGSQAAITSDLGTCRGTIAAPGQLVLADDGTGACSLDPHTTRVVVDGAPARAYAVTGAHLLPSGRVVVTFTAQ